jgi:oxygen-independent coproporphyrinogen-3 oxidase
MTLTHAEDPSAAFGVYVHVPFCERRCPYCDFSIAQRRQIPHEAYRDALLHELRERAHLFNPSANPSAATRSLWSVYFGGGTPSLWSPTCLAEVLRALTTRWGDPQEVTVEVNPGGDTDRAALATWRAAGVDRLSIGAQSFDPAALSLLGRTHTPDDVWTLLDDARAEGFERASIDLIIGRAGQTPDGLRADVSAALSHPLVEQVSSYLLTIEPRTPYARQEARGIRRGVDDDEAVSLLDTLDAALSAGGLTRYEPSNSARWGRWSKHNLLYWRGGEYLGLGMGAHSMRRAPDGGARRRAATRDLKRYLGDPLLTDFTEDLSPSTHLAERVFLALRTRFTLDLKSLLAPYDLTATQRAALTAALAQLSRQGWVTDLGQGCWQTTPSGLRFHDDIAAEVLGALSDDGADTSL